MEGYRFLKGFSFYTGKYRTREDTDGNGPELREKFLLHDRQKLKKPDLDKLRVFEIQAQIGGLTFDRNRDI